MKCEGEELARKYVWDNIAKLCVYDQKKVSSVEDQFKIAYFVYGRFKYRPWFTNLTYQFWQYYRYEIYWMEYMIWLQKKGFLDFVPPSDLQDHRKTFIINNEEVQGSTELFSEFMEEKAQCRIGGRKETVRWGDFDFTTTRLGRKFEPPVARRKWRPRKKKEKDKDVLEKEKED